MRTTWHVVTLTLVLAAVAACGQAAPIAAPTDGPSTPAMASVQPGNAREYRTAAAVLEDAKHGPELCYEFKDSYPSQCTGPEVAGWDWDLIDDEQSVGGTTWVDSAVLTGTWDGERFTLTRPVERMTARSDPAANDLATFAPGCDHPDVVDPTHGHNEVDAVIEPLERAGVSAIRVSDPSGPWDGPFVLTVIVPPGRAHVGAGPLGRCGRARRHAPTRQRSCTMSSSVPGGNDEKLARALPQQVAVTKVTVLGDHDPILGVGQARDVCVGRLVAIRQFRRVHRLVAGRGQLAGKSSWKLRVNEELHAAPSGMTRRLPEVSAPNSRAASRSSRSRSE